MSEHTQGPWQRGLSSKGKTGTSITIWRNDEGPNSDADTNTNYRRVCQHVHNEADAHLIAAAPDMLAALKTARNWFGEIDASPDDGVHSLCAELDAVIARAEGK